MGNNFVCPLCESATSKFINRLRKKDLLKSYKKFIKIDIGYLINSDIDYYECLKCGLRFYYPPITGDEIFYNALQKFDWYYMDEKEEYHFVKEYISNNDKVLEVGSGKGAFVKYLSTDKYIGLDFSENAKKMAAENGIIIENDTIENYAKFHEKEFDAVVNFQVLEHVTNPKSFIEASLKVLNSEGLFIVSVPSEESFLKYAVNSILNMPPHHITRWSDNTFEFIAKKYNLELIDIFHEKVSEYHKLWYLHTLVRNSLKNYELIDVSLVGKYFDKFSSFIAKILMRGIKKEMLPNGHTVIAIFKKI